MANRGSIQPVSNLINLDFLPNEFRFIQQGSDAVFDKVFYKNLRKSFIGEGEGWIISMDILIDEQIGFDLFGTGLTFAVNPSSTNNSITEFNVILEFILPIKRFISQFNLNSFSWSVAGLLEIFDRIFDINLSVLLSTIHNRDIYKATVVDLIYLIDTINQKLNWVNTPNEITYTDTISFADIASHMQTKGISLAIFLTTFEIPEDNLPVGYTYEDALEFVSLTQEYVQNQSLEEFITDLNNKYNINIQYNNDTAYDDIAEELESNNISVLTILLDYVLTDITDIDEAYELLSEYVSPIAIVKQVPLDLKTLLPPYFAFNINSITLALAFPRTWLKPIDPATNQPYEDESIKSMLRFTVGSMPFSTENGFEFENESSISFDRSEIGNTGLTISFTNAKLDLSRTTNIPEAAA